MIAEPAFQLVCRGCCGVGQFFERFPAFHFLTESNQSGTLGFFPAKLCHFIFRRRPSSCIQKPGVGQQIITCLCQTYKIGA